MSSLAFIFFLYFTSQTTSNCSCYIPSVSENATKSDAIFEAKVIKVDTLNVVPEIFIRTKGGYTVGHLVTLKLKNTFKGNLSDTISLMTGNGGGDCGYYFIPKKTYLIYAYTRLYYLVTYIDKHNSLKYRSIERRFLTTTICDRTTDNINTELPQLQEFLQKNR